MQSYFNENDFTAVDLSKFLDTEEISEETGESGIVVLTQNQKLLCDELNSRISLYSPQHQEIFDKRMADLKRLAVAIAEFPSLLSRATLTSETRTPQDIIELLVDTESDYGKTFIQLPSKATLGKGFLTAKLHTFSALAKLAVMVNDRMKEQTTLNASSDNEEHPEKRIAISSKLIQAFRDETVSMMFLLLAEDVYLNLIKDDSLNVDFRRQLATSLLLLWEHRADQNISDIAPVLTSVWKARRTLAPAFGTMMGTSELIMFSFQMDEVWSKFIRTQLAVTEVSQAMEEFLFGISYEQIQKLKRLLREKGIGSIGRDEVSKFLGEKVKTDVSGDYKDFYSQYSIRRDNAQARKRLNLEGPHRTLEDHFIRFVMEQNREKQNNDSFAKTN
ncbi:hypothetical protein [uncultured Treponema sp.]|uniref:hypothetical protein n=1 Tax=uncultured Treponema sp. TaxID=162155 RepID=UPI0015B7AD80|nr:hypothetical protein [uncultured Treponema sp.]